MVERKIRNTPGRGEKFMARLYFLRPRIKILFAIQAPVIGSDLETGVNARLTFDLEGEAAASNAANLQERCSRIRK